MVACPHLAAAAFAQWCVVDSICQFLICAYESQVVNLQEQVNLFAFKVCSVYGLIMCCSLEG